MEPLFTYEAALGAFLATALLPGTPLTRRAHAMMASLGIATGAILAGLTGLLVLVGGAPADLAIRSPTTSLLAFHLRADALASFALVAFAIVAFAVALSIPGYVTRAKDAPGRGWLAMLSILFLSILVVATARQATTLLIAWETMSLAGYFLVTARNENADARRAGTTYFVLAHVTGALLFTAFAALYATTRSFDFDAYQHLAPTTLASVALVAALLGLGAKAGLVPFHGWVPPAYREAPAPASAAMSGIMSKMAVFLLLRFLVEFLAPGPEWWGYATLALGAVSMLVGILYALQEDDLKRLLAYSSIENLGIIFTALGLGELLLSHGLATLALLAFAAAIFHALNHATFKTLLFLASGNVENEVGTLDMDQLGGLAKRMRWTSGVFLVGALAISALPPLNGFVSEWLLYQTLVGTVHAAPGAVLVTAALATISLMALSGGLAVATFVKAQGVTFHAMPRSRAAAGAREAPTSSLAPLALLAGLCVGLALASPAILASIQDALAPHVGASLGAIATRASVQAVPTMTSLAPIALLVAVIALAALPLLVVRVRMQRSTAERRRGPAWACGWRATRARANYTSLAIAKPLRMMFSTILLPDRVVTRTPMSDPARSTVAFRSRPTLVAERFVYEPLARATSLVAERLRVIQKGSVRVYIAYILVVLVALLTYVSVTP